MFLWINIVDVVCIVLDVQQEFDGLIKLEKAQSRKMILHVTTITVLVLQRKE